MPQIKDVYNFYCEVFKPETSDLSKKEIKVMLRQLYEYYPYTQSNDGDRKPYDPSSEYSKKWFQSYNHLLMLLDMRKQDAKHNISLGLSIVAIVVSIAGVAIRFSTIGQ